MDSCVRISITR